MYVELAGLIPGIESYRSFMSALSKHAHQAFSEACDEINKYNFLDDLQLHVISQINWSKTCMTCVWNKAYV